MKHMKWLALLTALVMVLGMGAAMGEENGYVRVSLATSDSSVTDAPAIGWDEVLWEDKGIDVTFGFYLSSNGGDSYFYIDILQQGTDKWNAQYALLDEKHKALADQNSLMLLDIKHANIYGDPLTLDGTTCSVYIQITEPWGGKNAFHFAYLADGNDEAFGTEILTDPYGQKGEFLKVNAEHFSPFAAYVEGDPVAAPVAPPAGSVPSTGDQSAPAMWLALAAMSAAVVIGFGRKARKA